MDAFHKISIAHKTKSTLRYDKDMLLDIGIQKFTKYRFGFS